MSHPQAAQAAQAALHAAQWQQAKALFEAALAEQDTPEVRDGLGLALWWLNEVSAAHEHRTRAYLGYKQRGDARRAAWLAAWLAREQVFLRANASAMNGWFARADRLLADQGPCAERGWVDVYRASMTASPQALEQTAQTAIGLARDFADPDLEAMAIAFTGMARVALGRVNDGLACIDEAMAAATGGEVRDPFVVCEVFCVTLSACELAGDWARTDQWCQAASDYAQRCNSPFLSAYCRTTYGGLLAATGRWREAEATLTEAIRTFDAGHQALRVHAVIKLADLRVNQGRLEEAEVLLAGYEDYGSAIAPLARLHLARGETQLAQAMLAQHLQSSEPHSLHRAPLLRLLVDVHLARNDAEAARWAGEELNALAQRTHSDLLLAQAELAQGQIKRAVGAAAADAAQHFLAALDRMKAYEQSLLAGRAKLEMARTVAGSDLAGATAWARAAMACFERLGATRDVDEAAQVLRALGETRRTATRQQGVLTQREQEVLALLAHGLTNRQIAERLVISAKTAEHHVSQILAKLGLRSRVEAAAYVAKHK
jgi:ATP/maltotriose-dependent transcriptional regulator MalT